MIFILGVLEGFLGTFASIQTFVLCSLVNYLTDILVSRWLLTSWLNTLGIATNFLYENLVNNKSLTAVCLDYAGHRRIVEIGISIHCIVPDSNDYCIFDFRNFRGAKLEL